MYTDLYTSPWGSFSRFSRRRELRERYKQIDNTIINFHYVIRIYVYNIVSDAFDN